MKNIVITGLNGFAGGHLVRELASRGNINIIGVGREDSLSEALAPLVSKYHKSDISVTWPDTGPVDAVIHLAGLAAVGPSFDAPQTYLNLNSAMLTNLCEYYLKQPTRPRIIAISSGAIYDGSQPMPISESGPLGLSSPYAVSKVLNENQATYYNNRGLEVIAVRPFNHIGPGQALGFLLPDLYEKLKAAPAAPIKVGNLETKRDYTDVRDIVRAYADLTLASALSHKLYNICSGHSVSGTEIFNLLTSAMGLSTTYEIDPALVRPTDIMDIFGDASRIGSELGWHPEIPLETTIRDFISSQTP
jgi:GDP-4-dehydro-6-deoxy-D-mannose reductase